MAKNIGIMEMIIRILFAIIVASVIILNLISGFISIILILIAFILLLIALFGFRPIYSFFKSLIFKNKEKQ